MASLAAPHAKRARAPGSVGSSTSDPLPTSEGLTATERTAVGLLPTGDFDPWQYNSAVLKELSGVETSSKWTEFSHVPYLKRGPSKDIPLTRWCTLVGASTGKLESCHLVPAEHGEAIVRFPRSPFALRIHAVDPFRHAQIEGLVAGSAVPAGMRHEAPANRFPRESVQRSGSRTSPDSLIVRTVQHEFHQALDHHALHLIPSLDDVLARLAGEVMYYEQRKAADPAARAARYPTFRPPFDLFYKRLEARCPAISFQFTHLSGWTFVSRKDSYDSLPTNLLLARTEADITKNRATNNLALLPPVEILCSLNLVIAGMNGRFAQSEPVPLPVVEESQVSGRVLQAVWKCFGRHAEDSAVQNVAVFAHLLYRIWHLRDGDESHMEKIVSNVQLLTTSLLPDDYPLAPYLLHPTTHSIDDLPLLPQPDNTLRSWSHLTDPAQRLSLFSVRDEAGSAMSEETLSEQEYSYDLSGVTAVEPDVGRDGSCSEGRENYDPVLSKVQDWLPTVGCEGVSPC